VSLPDLQRFAKFILPCLYPPLFICFEDFTAL